MPKAIRKEEILDILRRYHYVTVKYLSETLYISQSSIRRDLAILETQGLVIRSHGGVYAVDNPNTLTPFLMRLQENSVAKRAICRKAAALVSDGDVLFIDGSTTCLFLPEFLSEKKNLTILTNSTKLSDLLLENTNATVYSTGGIFRISNEPVLTGSIAENTCRTFHSSLMFFSSRAVSGNGIITDLNEPETHLRRVALQNTEKAFYLCDNTKFRHTSTFTVCSVDNIDGIVTDSFCESAFSSPSHLSKII